MYQTMGKHILYLKLEPQCTEWWCFRVNPVSSEQEIPPPPSSGQTVTEAQRMDRGACLGGIASELTIRAFYLSLRFYYGIHGLLYGGILLPPTCKINYVNMQHNYVNMRLINVDMHHIYVDMHVINFCQKLFFFTGKFSY